MRFNELYRHHFFSRIVGGLFFIAILCLVSDCQAQRQRRWFKRSVQVSPSEHQAAVREVRQQVGNDSVPQTLHRPVSPRFFDSRQSNCDSVYERFPKYIGGFHASQYYNIGVPPGDIGFRGNGIYWAPWN